MLDHGADVHARDFCGKSASELVPGLEMQEVEIDLPV